MRTFLVVLLLILFSPAEIKACTCEAVPFSLEAVKPYELIFIGEVVAVSGCDQTSKATFAIKELYRGKSFANSIVEFDCSSACQMSFAPGQTWIIYATYKKYGEADVNFCSFSRQKFASEAEDFNTTTHGMNFNEEQQWLKKNLGIQALNEKNTEAEQHHENIRPDGSQTLIYLGAGFLALILFYFLGRKFLK